MSREPKASGFRRPPWWVVVVGVLLALGQFGKTSQEFSAARSWPHEQATAIAIEKREPVRGCGKGQGVAQNVTWVSADPPRGLPAQFVTKNTCFFTEGETTTALRQLNDSGSVTKVWLDPVTSVWTVTGLVALGAFAPAFLFYAWLIARLVWRRYFWNDEGSRPAAG